MKCFDIKIGIKTGNSKTFWKSIGTVFLSDESVVEGTNGKAASFVIDYPACTGIIVPREQKEIQK